MSKNDANDCVGSEAAMAMPTYMTLPVVVPSKAKIMRLASFGVVKRGFDLIGSIVLLVGLSPLFAVVAAIIKLDSPGPVFFRQKRKGKNGKEFEMYKFRTMVPDSKKMLEKMLKDSKYKKQWDENKKIDNDPRITKIGRILRKTSLDELPQMINVLKNQMSFIGPRPLVPGELDEHNGDHKIYESVKPGITSWWASHGRSDTTYEERLALEYYYVQNRSLWLDIKCVFATIKAIVKKTGAK